jgi:hypothetical protein
VIFVLVGWLVPVADVLLVHLAFVPMFALNLEPLKRSLLDPI